MKLVLMSLIAVIAVRCCGQSLAPTESLKRAAAQSAKMTEVIEVTHCLKAGDIDWLGDSAFLDKSKVLHVAFSHDRKTYPGQDVIFVVVLESGTRGDVFELTHENQGSKRNYRVENNGSFKIGPKGLKWTGEILGGIWTHEYIERNIRRLLRQPSVAIPVRTALRSYREITCSSYVSD